MAGLSDTFCLHIKGRGGKSQASNMTKIAEITMKSVALHNLGCKVNAYELEAIGQKLQEKGYQIVPFDDIADVYIVNTCTVTNIADRKSRQMLHRAKRRNPDAVVVHWAVMYRQEKRKGCWTEALTLRWETTGRKSFRSCWRSSFVRGTRFGNGKRTAPKGRRFLRKNA